VRRSNQAAPIAADIPDFVLLTFSFFSFFLFAPIPPIARTSLSRGITPTMPALYRVVTPRRGHRSPSPIGVNLAVDQTPNIVAQSTESTT
jgi:hypothetical protein